MTELTAPVIDASPEAPPHTPLAQFEVNNIPFEVREEIESESDKEKRLRFIIEGKGQKVGEIIGILSTQETGDTFKVDTTVKEPATVGTLVPNLMARSISEIIINSPRLTWQSSVALNLGSHKMYQHITEENNNPESPFYQQFTIDTVQGKLGGVNQYILAKNQPK